MAQLGIEIDIDDKVIKYMTETHKRLQNDSLIHNPFVGKVKLIICQRKAQYLIDMTPVYPKVYLGGVFLTVAPLLFWGFGWWLSFGVCIMSLYFLWTKYFIYLALRLGLKKIGYKGKVKILTNEEIINSLLLY